MGVVEPCRGGGHELEVAWERLAHNFEFVAKLERLGRERALIYKTLVLTGLRKGELASLTVGQLALDAPMPFVPNTYKR